MKNLLLVLFLFGCARSLLKKTDDALRETSPESVILEDELETNSLIKALEENITQLKKNKPLLNFGNRIISGEVYADSLVEFIAIIKSNDSSLEKERRIKEKFDLYEVYGRDDWSEVLVTAYYTPVIQGSRYKTPILSRPLYKKPDDLVKVDVKEFQRVFDDFHVFSEEEEISRFRGRITEEKKIVPYWSREQIDFQDVLKGKKLELAWVDPVEAFFLQIQGSGKVDLPGKSDLYVHYEDQNGHDYHPIGKELLGKISMEEMSMQRIKSYLREEASEEEFRKILSSDSSYVFFRAEKTPPITSFGTQVHENRTIATDVRFYSNGTLAFLKFDNKFIPSRFVIDQDTGGGLKGRGRVDLYVGEGQKAGEFAGGFKEKGKLYYLAPKRL